MAYTCACQKRPGMAKIGRSHWDMSQLRSFCPACVDESFELNSKLYPKTISMPASNLGGCPTDCKGCNSCESPLNNTCGISKAQSHPYPMPRGENVKEVKELCGMMGINCEPPPFNAWKNNQMPQALLKKTGEKVMSATNKLL